MEWQDRGIVLSARPFGERSSLVELMTEGRGRHLGIVRGGRSRRLAAVLQPGNSVLARWRARLEDNLGVLSVEAEHFRAARLIDGAVGAFGIGVVAAHLRLLPERDAHPALFDAAAVVLDHLDDPIAAGPLMVQFELLLLAELGFGIDITRCAVSGASEGLAFVSPRTGRAVTAAAGAAYADRLLPLPRFLVDRGLNADPEVADVAVGLALTGHFLERDVLAPRGLAMPLGREHFLAALERARR